MDEYIAALDSRLAELDAMIEAVRAKYQADEPPPTLDSPTDPA